MRHGGGNCPTGDEIRRLVRARQGQPESAVPIMMLSSALGVAMWHLLVEWADGWGLVLMWFVPTEADIGGHHPTDLSVGLNLGSAEADLDMLVLRDGSFPLMTYDIGQDILPKFRMTKEPCWQRMNKHPHRPGRSQHKGGPPLRSQKNGRS